MHGAALCCVLRQAAARSSAPAPRARVAHGHAHQRCGPERHPSDQRARQDADPYPKVTYGFLCSKCIRVLWCLRPRVDVKNVTAFHRLYASPKAGESFSTDQQATTRRLE
eukprot:400451-Prymnesium_polylepis.1